MFCCSCYRSSPRCRGDSITKTNTREKLRSRLRPSRLQARRNENNLCNSNRIDPNAPEGSGCLFLGCKHHQPGFTHRGLRVQSRERARPCAAGVWPEPGRRRGSANQRGGGAVSSPAASWEPERVRPSALQASGWRGRAGRGGAGPGRPGAGAQGGREPLSRGQKEQPPARARESWLRASPRSLGFRTLPFNRALPALLLIHFGRQN